ncbi:phosphotransferase [Pseudomonas kermanshahensis]|uniref:phosphotransferase n=1 Tax=Pseudomonas kermanshahensis TaxID=2745482 RepID=UPI0023DC788A|nr:phosphotransferase [Pseudomonas kermanshahensis]WEL56890.1 phosphotransferase [Pseudomonas kermanshahensis]
MTAPTQPSAQHKTFFRWQRASLEHHIHTLMPQWGGLPLTIHSRDLESNASFVNYVRFHRLIDPITGKPMDVVEKSIRKVAFIGSQEARFHRAEGMLQGSVYFRYPPCLGVIETPWESLIFTRYIRGRPPRMQSIGRHLGRGIAEQEERSSAYIEALPRNQTLLLWSMDFFRPWFLLRPRFNFARCLPELERLAREDSRFTGLAQRLRAFAPVIRTLASQARRSPRCISHMDYLRKNLFIRKRRLYLIDWSEAKIGRIGFDGGAYLGSLFRRKEMSEFLSAQAQFEKAYREALAPHFDQEDALRNQRYVFLQTALYHCLRPETIKEYQEQNRMPLLLEKYEYLLTLL